jgi:hypothetical protein
MFEMLFEIHIFQIVIIYKVQYTEKEKEKC